VTEWYLLFFSICHKKRSRHLEFQSFRGFPSRFLGSRFLISVLLRGNNHTWSKSSRSPLCCMQNSLGSIGAGHTLYLNFSSWNLSSHKTSSANEDSLSHRYWWNKRKSPQSLNKSKIWIYRRGPQDSIDFSKIRRQWIQYTLQVLNYTPKQGYKFYHIQLLVYI